MDYKQKSESYLIIRPREEAAGGVGGVCPHHLFPKIIFKN